MKLNTQRAARCAAIVFMFAFANGGLEASAAPGFETPKASPERGLQLAIKLCSNCHAVEARDGGPLPAEAAPFASAANRPGQTFEKLEGYMLEPPHPAMPEAPLSRDQIRDLAAYILSLKKP